MRSKCSETFDICRVPVQTSEHKIAVLAGAVSGCLGAGADNRRKIIPRKTRYVVHAVLTRPGKHSCFSSWTQKHLKFMLFSNLTTLDSRKYGMDTSKF